MPYSDRKTLVPLVVAKTQPGCTVNTDEWAAYNSLPETGRPHVQVCHSLGQGDWARNDDGDGVREVHTNSNEGFWTGLRNFLRPCRGVNDDFLRAMMWRFTFPPT